MSLDDDRIREALRPNVQPYTASTALHELRPSMRRARWQRKVTSSAAGVAMLVGVGAGVAALATGPTQPTNPTVSIDATLPPADTTGAPRSTMPASTTMVTTPRLVEATGPVSSTAAQIPTSGDPDAAPRIGRPGTAPVTAVTPSSIGTPASTSAPAPTRPAPAPPVTPTITSQTITSACGDVVVSIDGAKIRILSIAPAAGFVVRVGDDGPTSIEVRLTGDSDTSCEIHAEMKSDGLDVEVQNPS